MNSDCCMIAKSLEGIHNVYVRICNSVCMYICILHTLYASILSNIRNERVKSTLKTHHDGYKCYYVCTVLTNRCTYISTYLYSHIRHTHAVKCLYSYCINQQANTLSVCTILTRSDMHRYLGTLVYCIYIHFHSIYEDLPSVLLTCTY